MHVPLGVAECADLRVAFEEDGVDGLYNKLSSQMASYIISVAGRGAVALSYNNQHIGIYGEKDIEQPVRTIVRFYSSGESFKQIHC